MNNRNNALAAVLVLAILIGLGYGVYLLLFEVWAYAEQLKPELVAILSVVLFAVIFIGLSIRRAGYLSGIKRIQLEQKARCYERFIKACCYPDTGSAQGDAPLAACQSMVLWAGPEVIRQLDGLNRREAGWILDPVRARKVVKPLIRAMRSDLGQSNLRLNIDQLNCDHSKG